MRKINGKLFLALLIGAFVMTGGVFAAHWFQYQRVARALLWQARKAEQDGQVALMARYLQRYLEFNPLDNAEKANLARTWTGEAFAGNARARSGAVRLLDDVLTSENDPPLRRLLIKTSLELGDYKMARDHLQRLMSHRDLETEIERYRSYENKPLPKKLGRVEPERGELESFWGQIIEQDKQPDQAMDCYRLAILHAPETRSSFVRLSYMLRRTGEVDVKKRTANQEEADRTMKNLVDRNATVAEAYLARWRYHRDFDLIAIREAGTKGKKLTLEDAANDITEALKRKPESVDVLLSAADLERLRGRSAAEDPLRDNAQRLAGLREHRDRALEHLRRGLELVKNHKAGSVEAGEFQLLWHKGNLLLDDLELRRAQSEEERRPAPNMTSTKEEIVALIEQVRKSRVPAAADYMTGRLMVHERRWGDAATLFERARALMASQPDLACQSDIYLGQCYERLEDHTQMFNAFKRVAEWDPNSVIALTGMAVARRAMGQLDDAASHYDVVIKQDRVPPHVWIDIARLEIQRQIQEDKPNWTRVVEALDNAEKVGDAKGRLEVALLRAEMLVRQGKNDKARDLLEQAKEKSPQEVDLWTALADLALRDNDAKRARMILKEARERVKNQEVSLRLADAHFFLATKDTDLANKLIGLSEGREKLGEDDQVRLLSGLADALLRSGNTKQARKMWQMLTTLPMQKNDLRLRFLLFDLAMNEGDEAGMKQSLEDIRTLEQNNGTYQHYGNALLLIWQARKMETNDARRSQNLKKASELLGRVLAQRPSWAPVFIARAKIAELNGTLAQEISELKAAVNNGDQSVTVLRRLVRLLDQSQNRESEQRNYLLMALKRFRLDPDLNQIAASVEFRAGDVDKALEYARTRVREDSKDPQELIWIGQVLALTDQPENIKKAEKMFDEAIKLAGTDPAPWVVKVRFLVAQKRKNKALAVIKEARRQLPAKQAPLALGLCYDAVHQAKEALACYAQALEANPGDLATTRAVATVHLEAGRVALAEPLLTQLVDGKFKEASADDVAWAKRSLAAVLANGIDYGRFLRALDLVGLKLDENGRLLKDAKDDDSDVNRLAKARVLASQQGQGQFRREAIRLFESLLNQGALRSGDKYVLALLLEAEGRALDARERLAELVRPSRSRSPEYLAKYVMDLIARKTNLTEAKEKIGWLEDLEVSREVGPNGYASVEMKARLLEVEKKGDQAVALLEKHVARAGAAPEEAVMVFASLTRQQRYAEAFQLCEKLWKEGKCAPEVVGGISVSLLQVMKPLSDAQMEKVQRHLQAAVEKKPRSAVLKMHLAALFDKRAEYVKAADQYREVLKVEPNNVVALNNLAWMMALNGDNVKEALSYISKAVNGMGRRADLLDTRGLVYLRLENITEAVADFEEAAKDAPTPSRLFHLAWAYHKDKNSAKARELLKQAKEKGLQVANLHPYEQDKCRELLTSYSLR